MTTPYIITFPLTESLSTGHWGIPQGTPGRGGNGIVGICLHQLTLTAESYIAYLATSMRYQDVRPGAHGSVQYLVQADGSIWRAVLDSNTAWGARGLRNPSWSLLGSYPGIDPNYLFIHIGLESLISISPPPGMFGALAQLLAYLGTALGIPLDADHVITHDELDTDYAVCARALFPNVLATAINLANTVQDALPDINAMSAHLIALQAQVDALQASVESSLAIINTFANHPSTAAGASTLGHVESSDTLAVDALSGVAGVRARAAAYSVTPSTTQTLVSGIRAIVQFGTVLSDPDGWMTLGAFQHFNIGTPGLYRVWARVQLAAADWTAGKYAQLDLYANGALFAALAVRAIEANLSGAVVELAGECQLAAPAGGPTVSYDVRIYQNDQTLMSPTKSISAGAVLVEKIGG